ncbi:hypothetical protein [Alteromonas oceanisediminis]|uniref:hypothetical protein n=1 Tax=Alteromonas oceanisediminis TaxID=2836180 RepID=UPI001BDABAFF|nr:hypothetical protein [Alteromonas oceanisediminis]MBT0586231.1 hypothetical protein [Alteromonas oceanisediminis]
MFKYIISLAVAFLIVLHAKPAAAQPMLLLTGKISSAQKQIVTAPRTNRWQIQIQWMEEEGEVVNEGDPIVTFDGSTVQSQLDINLERAETLALELKQERMTLEQAVLEAEGAFTVAGMRVEQAKIEASVPEGQVSQYDKGQYELTLQRRLFELFKAQEALKLARQALSTGVQKKLLELTKLREEIAFQQRQLTQMTVTSQYNGPVNYAMHPWSGEKLDAGINVQAAWQIMDVQAIDDFQIESYVHEIDALSIDEGEQVSVVFDAYPDKRFTARLSKKSTQSEKQPQWSNSVYVPLVFHFLQTPDIDMLPGMSVRIEVITDEA